MKNAVTVTAMLLALGSSAYAEADAPTDADSPARRDPGVALNIAAIGPIIGLGLGMGARVSNENASHAIPAIGVGLAVLTPTLAHVYTGDTWNTGFKIKLVGSVVASIGGGAMVGEGGNAKDAAPFVILGLGAVAVGTIWEIATASSSAESFNARHAAPGLALTPVVHGDGASVVLGGAF